MVSVVPVAFVVLVPSVTLVPSVVPVAFVVLVPFVIPGLPRDLLPQRGGEIPAFAGMTRARMTPE